MSSLGYFWDSGLPNYSNSSAVQEKLGLRHLSPWFVPVSLPIPGVRTRRLRLYLPNARRLHSSSVLRFGHRIGSVIFFFGFLLFVFVTFAFTKRFATRSKKWPRPFVGDPSTLIFEREDLQRIWYWEIASGHYPSRRSIPEQLGFRVAPRNPAIPPRRSPSRGPLGFANTTRGIGSRRTYMEIKSKPHDTAYPPRPIPGSVADLDVIMDHCDFSEKKYVRDCLEVLRAGAGLDTGNRLRRGSLDKWQYIYMEHAETGTPVFNYEPPALVPANADSSGAQAHIGNAGFEKPPIPLPTPLKHKPYASLPSPCDPDNPRVFHMFWTGPFTDKPYSAIMSFLYTQNTGLHLKKPDPTICRPEFWMWINPGPAAAVPNPSAVRDMFDELKKNPWASPFLHPRFHDIIHFKLWNTTEQLDGVPELKDEWRRRDLFNSGGNIIAVPQDKTTKAEGTATKGVDSDNLLNRAGSKSSSTYDRMSVILSDMARFVLCHRFGGTYLDADTIFLRDWEDLWGWKGAFAYRWSRLTRYNTAVLHMNKNSALGSFLFKTALKNDLDFHPMTISRYTKDAHLEPLLLRLPDALFDSAWLNTENYQRDRPPQPYFTAFEDFFETPGVNSAAPHAMGFDGFFKGAYSYHFHNFWWKPFDPSRNWPDLGERFAASEKQARLALESTLPSNITVTSTTPDDTPLSSADRRDLDWATVLKRTFEAYIRGERPNMYGEWLQW